MKTEAIPVRGHHLATIAAWDGDIKEFERLSTEFEYSNSTEDPTLTKTYSFLSDLRGDPDKKILVIAGQPDFICRGCRKMSGKCRDFDGESNPVYRRFFGRLVSPEDRDIRAAEEAGLKVGESYTVGEIIEATGEQTSAYRKSYGIGQADD